MFIIQHQNSIWLISSMVNIRTLMVMGSKLRRATTFSLFWVTHHYFHFRSYRTYLLNTNCFALSVGYNPKISHKNHVYSWWFTNNRWCVWLYIDKYIYLINNTTGMNQLQIISYTIYRNISGLFSHTISHSWLWLSVQPNWNLNKNFTRPPYGCF